MTLCRGEDDVCLPITWGIKEKKRKKRKKEGKKKKTPRLLTSPTSLSSVVYVPQVDAITGGKSQEKDYDAMEHK